MVDCLPVTNTLAYYAALSESFVSITLDNCAQPDISYTILVIVNMNNCRLENISLFILQSIWTTDCSFEMRWIVSQNLKMTKAIQIIEF